MIIIALCTIPLYVLSTTGRPITVSQSEVSYKMGINDHVTPRTDLIMFSMRGRLELYKYHIDLAEERHAIAHCSPKPRLVESLEYD
jgi:hypothetical protein